MPTLPPEAIPPLVQAFQSWGFPSFFVCLMAVLFGRPIVARFFKKMDRDEETSAKQAEALTALTGSIERKHMVLGQMVTTLQGVGHRIDEVTRDASHDRAQQSDLIIEARDAAYNARDAAYAARDAAYKAVESTDRLTSLIEAERRIPQANAARSAATQEET